ncbi:hypothetical protein CDAR_591141 [Caerostris darwini]|uniref:Uncharacterized protein n=1 Tax=Caerostris darwini TaxID=1538125 RepID=A0AAV4RMU5_9ARAC|nr:hypothetical protein CDAR_591141 [Caerostris darwini]
MNHKHWIASFLYQWPTTKWQNISGRSEGKRLTIHNIYYHRPKLHLTRNVPRNNNYYYNPSIYLSWYSAIASVVHCSVSPLRTYESLPMSIFCASKKKDKHIVPYRHNKEKMQE